MTTAMTTATTPIYTPDFLSPEAPTDYGKNRQCHKCKARVSRYTKPHWGGILLCYSCDRERVSKDLEVHLFVGTMKKGRHVSHKLPGLKGVREARGLTQKELADKAGVNPTTVRRLEKGTILARSRMAGKLARALGVETKELRGAE